MSEKDKTEEFVPEYFNWITMESQRKNVEKLEKITKKKKNNEKT